ncbi:MAG: replicative DNA helicase [Candidatus Ancillula sp.]|jgi:replicative DNA helicase|nr:replicative DNA helicase [Candidatus Ancillula sp.]
MVDLSEFDTRVPPQDLDAERAVVGGLLLNSNAFADVIDILDADDFYFPAYSTLFQAEIDLFADGLPVDAITVSDALSDRGELEKIGGALAIHEIVEQTPSTANISHYAGIVHKKSTMRKIIRAGAKIEQLGYLAQDDVENAINIAQNETYELSENSNASDLRRLVDLIGPTKMVIEETKNSDQMNGVPIGIRQLDEILHGLKGGQMVVVAARPGVGKSTLALDIARNATIRKNISTIIFNLEMSYTEIVMRLLSAENAVDHSKLRRGNLDKMEWQRIEAFENRLVDADGNSAPLFIDDSANMSMMQIRTKCRRLASSNTGLGLVIIDYLQLMSSGGKDESRQQEVAGLSRKIKLLAKELNIPIIAIAQLNRGSEQRQDKRPQLSDLRESGAIEQDADIVLFVHREEMYHSKDDDPAKARPGEADIIVAKNRGGITAEVAVSAQLHYCRFVPLSRDL